MAEHEAVLRAAFDTMVEGMLIVSASGRITHYNRRFLEIWSIPPDHPAVRERNDAALIALVAGQVIDGDDFPAQIQEICRAGERTEDLVRLRDGRVLERVSFPVPLPAEAETERVWQFRDITARKQAEAAAEKRLGALARPTIETISIGFDELFDLAEIQQIQDHFAEATGVASIITRPDGTPITRPSNFCRLCKDIIRKTPAGLANCYCSDAVLGRHHPGGPVIQPCLSGGLWDAGASITVGGRHVANWLIGQVRDKTQSEERMREYARTIGADEGDLLAAFHEVPAMSRAQFERVAQALYSLSNRLSVSAYQNLQMARHIAERRQAEAALQAKTDELDRYFNSSLDLLCIASATTGRFLRLNPEWERTLGYPLAELRQSQFIELVHPDDRADTQAAITRLSDQSEVLRFVNRFRCKDGSYRWIEWNSRPMGDQIYAVARDITERKRTEAALRASERKLAEIFRSSPEMIVVTAVADGRILELNEACARMLGYTRAELLGRTTLEINVWATPAERDRVIGLVRQHSQVQNIEVRFRRKNGGFIDVLLSMAPLQLEGQDCLITLATEITAIKQAEAARRELERQLQHTQKLESLGVLAGGIAHDFNNLLMAILGNLDLALLDIPAASPARESIEQSVLAARRAADLTRQMLAYSGKGSFVIRSLDLNALVTENAHLFRACISRLIDLRVEIQETLPSIRADAGQIQQVVMNLITNASEAIGDRPGCIRLHTSVTDCDATALERSRTDVIPPAGRFVVLEVTDTGCGMDEPTQQKLFDPFFTTKFTGRGLGMSAILGIVRAHDGAIFVDSIVGQGSSIRVLLPAQADVIPPATTSKDGLSVPSPTDRPSLGTILIVDDEDIVRRICKHMLTRQGWRVIEAADGVQGLDLFRQQPDEAACVILDLSMPNMGGIEVFRAMRLIRPDVRIILTSGYSSDQSTSAQLAGEGLAGFIQKPFTAQTLLHEIERALKRP